MGNILSKLGAFRNKAIKHEIDGVEFKFYPPRMRMLMSGQMREIMEPISEALATLFVKNDKDTSQQHERNSDGSQTIYIAAISPEMAEMRSKQRRDAIRGALAALLDDETRYKAGTLLADSLRDDFSPSEAERAGEMRKFMDELDFPTFVKFMQGYFKALAPVLDASGNSILSDLQGLVKREVATALGQDGEAESGATEETTPSSSSPSESDRPKPQMQSESSATPR